MINFLPGKLKKKNKGKALLLFIFFLLAVWVYYLYSLNMPVSSDAELKSFTVTSGQGSRDISRELKQNNFIRRPLVFQFYVWQQGISSKLKSGEYFLAPNLSTKEIADALFAGPGQTKEKTLTFIEGWNLSDFANYLENQGIVKSRDFLTAVQKKADFWNEYEILADKPKNLDLEGYLFPDTYRVYSDTTAEEIVKKMFDNMSSKLTAELRAEIKRQGKTIHEILTLASIIEKEVSSDKDRKLVADIFYKRLDAGVALQADSAVNYVTGKSTPRASAQDLAKESPYNTYRYRGLPPGPIASPGLSAILAAVYPTANPYWYFLTTPAGQAIYSKTFEEHVANKAKYY
ncbi:MAG: hypothetical protein A2744_04275 [Candidatus Buchananbacteria bacterium RIFCSPHIGHO2_01_FULL_44_11]|uniref:Endolytic murein transglycosylase n=1 Tax=Candidatus Buchananbacteria bacterium RIFCSPHIGHO2_01_FULL_44_11 TaxID=1797535 RepID=A0A1G1XZF1_9BACT|nr:MAG: hypothetical protein A2744_04275 [Candidatus Buchananbacteria bacterium RIFCSPHIGHO2_01_FULL_44_11]